MQIGWHENKQLLMACAATINPHIVLRDMYYYPHFISKENEI